jgi:hypothetical protein
MPFWKWRPPTGRNFSMSGINSGHYYLPTYQILMISDNVEFLQPIFYAVFWQPCSKWQTSWKFWKCRIAMSVDYDVLNWFLTSKNFYRSPFSKWPPQYRTNSTLSDFNEISYVGRLWCPELIPDIEKLWNFVEIEQCWICAVLWWPFWKWQPVEIFQCQESIRDIIISTSWIDSQHKKISTDLHFQNGRHNTAKIQHCSISKVAFDNNFVYDHPMNISAKFGSNLFCGFREEDLNVKS